VTPVDVRHWVSDDVLEVDPTLGALESVGAAALNYGVLAAPVKLYPARHVWIPLRLKPVCCREPALRSAGEAANEDPSPLSKYTPLGVSLNATTFVYKQPSRLPVITSPG
jgi:hypothetical protein